MSNKQNQQPSQQQQGEPKKSASERLEALLGHDPTKGPNVTGDLLLEVLAEVNAENRKEAKKKVVVLLKEAVQIRKDMEKSRKDFAKADEKFNSGLGKLLTQLEQMGKS